MKTYLDWSRYQNAGMGDAYADIPKNGGNFAKAIAVCINSHHCEEKGKGVMCPSYRISDEPLLSTGGRVKMLKTALNTRAPLCALNDRRLAEAMDLCVGCKGCKRECENEVDMAMLKIEYLAQRNETQGVSLRSRLFAELPGLLASAPWLKSLIRVRNRSALLAKLVERWFHISAKRVLPEPKKAPAFAVYAPADQHRHEPVEGKDNEVVLYLDTFTRQFEPENATAAIEVLEHAGYRVHVVSSVNNQGKNLCCGRTRLAQGMVDKARHSAQQLLDALAPFVDKALPVIGLEPACLLAIRDDYRFLGLGEQAEKTASLAVLFEEFLAREHAAKRLKLDLQPYKATEEPVLVHGHCHQKAVGAMKSMRKVLKLIPGLKFELIESSCCGMAGHFGLEKEHEKSSLAMAELSLYPTIRNNPQADIVANGFSCRHQIREGTQKQASHIAVLLQGLLRQQ
jgi:glycerol-3-phosphate dehydrogenase subunit C